MNNPKATETYDELLRRFPDGENTAHTYYDLYRMYHVDGNNGDARYYKNKLTKDYPDTEYARMLVDPDYFKKLQEFADKVKVFYKSTFDLYLAKDFDKVKANCAKAKVDYPDNEKELAKFEMLNAMSIGHARDTAAFITALEVVVNTYPESEVKPKAVEMIALLKIKPKANGKGVNTNESLAGKTSSGGSSGGGFSGGGVQKESIFKYEPDAVHMFLILADKRNVKISDLKNRVSDHNKKYFGTESLTVSAIPINKNILLVGVSNFANEQKALEYFKTARRNSVLYSLIKKNGGDYFIISDANYSRLYRSKDLDGYINFYNQYYGGAK